MSVAAAELFLTSHLRLGGAPLSRGPWTAHYTLHITRDRMLLHITRDTICYILGHYMLAAGAYLASCHEIRRDKYSRKLRIYFKGVKFLLCFLETLWTRTAPAAARTNVALFSQSASPVFTAAEPSPAPTRAKLPPALLCSLQWENFFAPRL